ncbi:MAG: aminotransferase class V-fold PLP-dependent enzyme [Candidatus Schekmanbacteria bacterium]|nr:aminotransferase class V-fold PLP-dependent enzyme [Candidatus Schekmanbacteria bacterium]
MFTHTHTHTPLLSVQWVCGETGVVQPLARLAAIAHRSGASLHVDAAQAVGRLPIDLAAFPGIDFLTFSGHKLHGPLGTGVLYAREPRSLTPLLLGGEQERGVRSGTENLPGIVGLALACELRRRGLPEAIARMRHLRDRFEARVIGEVVGAAVNGAGAPRVGNTSNLRFLGLDGQALLAQLDRRGIACSQGSACSSRRPQPSHVLRAMGLSEDEAFSSLRFSFSVLNTNEDVERAACAIKDATAQLRALPSLLEAL